MLPRVFLRGLGKILRTDRIPERQVVRSVLVRRPARRRLRETCGAAPRWVRRLLDALDCHPNGKSRRTGEIAWPESWEAARWLVADRGAESLCVHILAAWLERHAPTTRATYASAVGGLLESLRIETVKDLVDLPTQAGLTWQRTYRRQISRMGTVRQPRTINTTTSALNSLMGFIHDLGMRSAPWVPVPLVAITAGRHIDREATVLTAEQLGAFWECAANLPRRRFLALMLASLHGLRRSEVATLQWGNLRASRRGVKPAPAVFNILGKGQKPRRVCVHPAVRPWLERERVGKDATAFILADASGAAPTPKTISNWAKVVFRRLDMPEGYAHALRATWSTLALENRANQPLQVQQSGGWKRMETMTGHYFKRRQIPLIDILGKQA